MDNNINWHTLTITIDRKMAGDAAVALAQISGLGVRIDERDEEKISRLTCYIASDPEAEEKTRLVKKFINGLARTGTATLTKSSVLQNRDWCGEWKKQFKPLKVGNHLVIRPTWEDYRPGDNEKVLILDPGMAFGTGHHESTAMALELIDNIYHPVEKNGHGCSGSGTSMYRPQPPTTVLDLGCGTGILALACATLGATAVTAIDNDPEAVNAAKDNIRLNGLAGEISAAITPVESLEQNFDLVCANIIHNTLVELAGTISDCCAGNGLVLLAGILSGWQEDNIARIYRDAGFVPVAVKHKNEWAAILMGRDD